MADIRDIYLDNNASAPLREEARKALMAAVAVLPANPSSAHRRGGALRRVIEQARSEVAALLGGFEEQVVFTSGGTESNNTAIAAMQTAGVRTLMHSGAEHPSVVEPCAGAAARGLPVEVLRVTGTGRLDLKALEEALKASEKPAGVCLQVANSETGVMQPVAQAVRLCREYGALLLLDAAQAVGRTPVDFHSWEADFLSFSGHKLHAPQGVGALLVHDDGRMNPLLRGGGQEAGRRSGTEPAAAIAALGAACAARAELFTEEVATMKSLRARLEAGLGARIEGIEVNGAGVERVANTANVRFPGVDGQALVAQLDAAGVYCSQSSACSSGRPEPSRVLRAMGLTEAQAYESVRFSVSCFNTEDEVDSAVELCAEIVERLRRFAGLRRDG